MIHDIDGGITAAKGFRAAGVACGIKRRSATATTPPLDLALIVADGPVSAAAVFTTNKAVAAPVVVSREHLAKSGGRVAAIVVNAGCANACTGDAGLLVARQMAEAAASAVRCAPHEVLVASTGVIGMPLSIDKVRGGVAEAATALSGNGSDNAMRAIMTTDPFPKAKAVSVVMADGRTFVVGGIAKGSGMIEPRMATMLGFLTTDAQVAPAVLQGALKPSTPLRLMASAPPTIACFCWRRAHPASRLIGMTTRRCSRGCGRCRSFLRAKSCAAAKVPPSSSP
jgi:glutamate N-acetyltransferase/amino-acid N-acetyltransferase